MREPAPLSSKLHGRVLRGDFRPHPWFTNPHLQTMLPLLRPTPKVTLRIERRELPDGDFVDIGWCAPPRGAPSPRPGAPLVVMLHGLTGGFEAKYARGTALNLMEMGWRVLILQFRGAGPEPNRLPRNYHHGDTEDLRELLVHLREREPDTKLFAVGWSLGGNVLLKYLGEEGDKTPLAGAVAACPPFQIKPCAERLRSGFSRIYQHHLLTELKAMLQRKHAVRTLPIDIAEVVRSRDFFEFDDRATALLNGFKDAEDYYARASCGQYLRGIARPTLAISAKDDPFMTPSIIPNARALPPQVTVEACDHGGHVGFIAAGPAYTPRWWLEERIPRYLRTLT